MISTTNLIPWVSVFKRGTLFLCACISLSFTYVREYHLVIIIIWIIILLIVIGSACSCFTDNPEKKSWLAVYAAWDGTNQCQGKFVRDICIFGVGDLKELVSRKELFANKFYLDFQYLGLKCLEEYINNKTFNPMRFDSFYYKQLSFVRKT